MADCCTQAVLDRAADLTCHLMPSDALAQAIHSAGADTYEALLECVIGALLASPGFPQPEPVRFDAWLNCVAELALSATAAGAFAVIRATEA